MSDLKEIIVGAVIGLVTKVETNYAEKLIQQLKTDNEDYPNDLKAGYLFLKRLKKATDKSATQIDDVLVNPLYEAVVRAASEDGIELPE